ncbi:DNA methyltransferase [Pedobacter panaciterrae]|uniref:DNA methyltransferase n=1 Tax=Pedobacter panaciterrae TaxID=363849 RepID=UPI002598A9A2|nr:DNA methyltransferase [uncultured Pedobacter sp.]
MVEAKEILYKDSRELYSDLVSFAGNRYQPIHRWYSLVEGFSSEFVRRLIGEQSIMPKVCFDPFMGVGTTALTCQDLGVKCFGIENSPFFYDVTRTKLRSDYDPDEFAVLIDEFEIYLNSCSHSHPLPEMETKTLFQTNERERWIFNEPVREGISDILEKMHMLPIEANKYFSLFKLAIGSHLVAVSNVFRNGKCLSFKKKWEDNNTQRSDVHSLFINYCRNVLLVDIRSKANNIPKVHNYVNVMRGDSRTLINSLPENSIDIVISSPPYLNSRDYTDIYRLELWMLGYVSKFNEEKKLRSSALTSHVQIAVADSISPNIQELNEFLTHLETIGTLWNKNIPNMIKGYFSDMESIFENLHPKLKEGAMVYINVSNSAYGNKICEVDTILAKIAETKGYEAQEIRTARYINSSKQQEIASKLRESVIVLKKNSW